MMVVVASEHVHMQRHPCRLTEALQAMVDHLRRQCADLLVLEAELADEEGARGDVNHGAREGLVERGVRVAEALQAFAVAEGFGESLAEAEEGVFSCVVVVNCEGWGRGSSACKFFLGRKRGRDGCLCSVVG